MRGGGEVNPQHVQFHTHSAIQLEMAEQPPPPYPGPVQRRLSCQEEEVHRFPSAPRPDAQGDHDLPPAYSSQCPTCSLYPPQPSAQEQPPQLTPYPYPAQQYPPAGHPPPTDTNGYPASALPLSVPSVSYSLLASVKASSLVLPVIIYLSRGPNLFRIIHAGSYISGPSSYPS